MNELELALPSLLLALFAAAWAIPVIFILINERRYRIKMSEQNDATEVREYEIEVEVEKVTDIETPRKMFGNIRCFSDDRRNLLDWSKEELDELLIP